MNRTIALIAVLTVLAVSAYAAVLYLENGREQTAQSITSVGDAVKNQPATGVLDGVTLAEDGVAVLEGWAYDPDDSSRPVIVHFFAGGPVGSGTYAGRVVADSSSRGLANSPVSGNHGFSFVIPEQHQETNEKWYAYVIDLSTGTSLLDGSGKKLVIPRTDVEVFSFPEQFGNTQGANGWSYQYSSGGSYVNMVWNATGNRWDGNEAYLRISDPYIHPGASADAVLAWTVPKSGEVNVNGRVIDSSPLCGDGVRVRIQKGEEVLWNTTVRNGEAIGIRHSLTAHVAQGDTIRFIVNKNGEDLGCDATTWHPRITYVSEDVTHPEGGYDIIIVAGQSNAVGAGQGAFTDPKASTKLDTKIFQLGRNGKDDLKVIPATATRSGNTYDVLQHWMVSEDWYTRSTRMGFAIPFARRYAEEQLTEGRKVLIIPAAYGGTSILKWNGEVNHPVTTPVALLTDMQNRINVAMKLPGDNRVVAFLWHQGETDVILSTQWKTMTPEYYESKLSSLLAKVRLDNAESGSFPMIGGMFVPEWPSNWAEHEKLTPAKHSIEQVIRSVFTGLTQGGVVESTGLSWNIPTDQVHFSSASQVILGGRYYQKWKELKK